MECFLLILQDKVVLVEGEAKVVANVEPSILSLSILF